MKQIVNNACGFFGAMIRNIFIIILAAVLILIFGIARLVELNDQLSVARAQISSLSDSNAEKDAVIAAHAETISEQEQQIAELRRELEDLSPDPSILVRMELRVLGCFRLMNVSFPRSVSREIFDSLSQGDEISEAPWLDAVIPSGVVSARFFVADMME